jgi:hypothetical protein
LHAAINLDYIGISQVDQGLRGVGAHAAAAAVEHDSGLFIGGQLIQIGFDFIVGNEGVSLG